MKYSNTNSRKALAHLLAFSILSLPLFAQAAVGLQNPLKGVDSISELILIVTRVVRYIAIPFVVLAIMYSGWLYIYYSYLDPTGAKVKDAHKSIYYTVIGVFILLSAELIALVMRNTINSATN